MSDSKDRGRVISGNTGPLNLGKGDINTNTVVIKGNGKVIEGDNTGGISRSFGGKKKR